MSNRIFTDKDSNITLASGEISDDYILVGSLKNATQSSAVPFTWLVGAFNKPKDVTIYVASEEKFFQYKSKFVEQTARTNPDMTRYSFRNIIEPDEYLKEYAQEIFGSSLTLEATAACPSLYNINLENSYRQCANYAQAFADNETRLGYQCNVQNLTCQSILYKYKGIKDGKQYTVLAAVDYEGYEFSYPMAGNMLGGLFGLNRGKNTQKSDKLGYGGGDIIVWGSRNRYLMFVPCEYENEACNDFLKLLSTFEMDHDLQERFYNILWQRLNMTAQQVMMYQNQTRINIANNQYQQQKLNNMLRENSQSISAGLMDSWNKKMDSQSRMSNNFSEAIRGVNTYTTTDGRNVEVDVSADHVYENKYGDVYGVSGNALDDDLLNRINWTEINKK